MLTAWRIALKEYRKRQLVELSILCSARARQLGRPVSGNGYFALASQLPA